MIGISVFSDLCLPDSLGFDRLRDPHGDYGDVGDPGLFHPTEFAVAAGRHGARDAGRRLDELRCFHDEFPLVFPNPRIAQGRQTAPVEDSSHTEYAADDTGPFGPTVH